MCLRAHTYMHVGPSACDSQKCICICKAPLNFPNPIDGDLAILLKSQWRCIRDIPKQKCISPWDGIKPLRWFAFHTTVRQRYRRSKQSHTPEICNWGILEWKMWSKYNPTKRKCQWGITKKSIYGIYVTFLFFNPNFYSDPRKNRGATRGDRCGSFYKSRNNGSENEINPGFFAILF